MEGNGRIPALRQDDTLAAGIAALLPAERREIVAARLEPRELPLDGALREREAAAVSEMLAPGDLADCLSALD